MFQVPYAFDERIMLAFDEIKEGDGGFRIPVRHGGRRVAELLPLTKKHLREGDENDRIIRLLAQWREENAAWYPTVFTVTEEGTRRWLKDRVIGARDRLLFLVMGRDGDPIGHMGFFRGEADNILRGRKGTQKGAMALSLRAMLDWAFSGPGMEKLYLRVFRDNEKAMVLYGRCGFREIGRIPLKRVVEGDSARWEETDRENGALRYYSVMMATNPYRTGDGRE